MVLWFMSAVQDTMEVKEGCFSLEVWDHEYSETFFQNK